MGAERNANNPPTASNAAQTHASDMQKNARRFPRAGACLLRTGVTIGRAMSVSATLTHSEAPPSDALHTRASGASWLRATIQRNSSSGNGPWD
jgi:hypothetical protein